MTSASSNFKKLLRIKAIWRERGTRGLIELIYQRGLEQLNGKTPYPVWLARQQPNVLSRTIAQLQVSRWQQRPTFSILLVVETTHVEALKNSLQSVLNQVYSDWELWIIWMNSTEPEIPFSDLRIRTIVRPDDRISAACNLALRSATGDYVLLLNSDDELAADALLEVARLIQHHPEAALIYSDADSIDANRQHYQPFFKPDWSPEYLQACWYTGHLSVYRASWITVLGGFRAEFEGAYEYDLTLRLTEKTRDVYHIPRVLYHARRPHLKPLVATQSVLESMLDRSPYPGWVEPSRARPICEGFRVRRTLIEQPLISLIIPSAGKTVTTASGTQCLLEQCLRSIDDRSTYRNLEIVIVDGYDIPNSLLDHLTETYDFQLVRSREPFNFSQRINLGVAQSTGLTLLLLNDDVEVLTPDWLEIMLELAQQAEIGAVGAKLRYPDRTLQHVGVLLLAGSPVHAFHGAASDHPGYFGSNCLNRNYLAVTAACLMIRRAVYEQVGGLDAAFPLNYNDVDFCLKVHQAGYRNVVAPAAELIHHESVSRSKQMQPGEWAKIRNKWRSYLHQLHGDPYYNPNLSHHDATFEFTGAGLPWI